MKRILGLIMVSLVLFSTFLTFSQATAVTEADKPTMVNIQVDMENEGDEVFVYNILGEVESRGWRVTVYVTGEFALNHADTVKDIHDRGHQIAVNGWSMNEDLTLMAYEQQLQLLNMSFFAVRSAVGIMRPAYISDFRPQHFKQNADTFKALQELGIRSNSGFIAGQGSSRPYHTTYGFVAIPISALYEGCGCAGESTDGILLCDYYIFDVLQATAEDYLTYLTQKFDQNNASKEPIATIVHSSIVGEDTEKLEAFTQFLEHIKNNNGEVVLTDYMTTIANPYIKDMTTSGPDRALPGQTVTLTITYTPTCWCPYYHLKIYGRYKQGWWDDWWHDLFGWNELDSWTHFHGYYDINHPYTWQRQIQAPLEQGTYLIRVVGRACHGSLSCWPTAQWYEAVAHTSIEIALSLEVEGGLSFFEAEEGEESIPGPVFNRGGSNPVFSAKVPNARNVAVEILGTSDQTAKSITLAEKEEDTWQGEWDWTSEQWSRIPEDIPVGEYTARFKVTTNGADITEDRNFYVVFNPTEVAASSRFVYDEVGVWFAPRQFGKSRDEVRGYSYALHPDDSSVFLTALDDISGETSSYDAAVMLYDWVRNRFVSVDDKRDNDVLELLARADRKAQCADEANMLVALLRSVGIPSYPVAVDMNLLKVKWGFDTWVETRVKGPDGEQWYVLHPHQNVGPETRIGAGKSTEPNHWVFTKPSNDVIISGREDWNGADLDDEDADLQFEYGPNERPLQDFDYPPTKDWITNLSEEYWDEPHWTGEDPPAVVSLSLNKEEYQPGEAMSITVTILNTLEVTVTGSLSLTVASDYPQSKRFPDEILYSDEREVTVPPISSLTITESYWIPLDLSSDNIYYANATFSGETAVEAFTIDPLFSASLTLPDVVEENEAFTAELTIVNPSATSVTNISVAVDLPFSIVALDSSEKNVTMLLPGATESLSWNLRALLPSEVSPVEFVIASDNGGSTTLGDCLEIIDVELIDLSISTWDVLILPGVPREGDSTYISVTVHNDGNDDARNVEVELVVDGIVTEERTIDVLTSSAQVNFQWVAETGRHTFMTRIDPENHILEQNEGNNEYSWELIPGIPDFTVGTMSVSPEYPTLGSQVHVFAVIDNMGNNPLTNLLDIAFLTNDDVAELRTIDLNNIPYEGPLYTWNVDFYFTFQPGIRCITIVVDPADKIEEAYEDNNNRTLSMPDDTPPTTVIEIGEPKYSDLSDNIYASSATPFTLTAEDNSGGTGVASTSYRVHNSSFDYDTGWLEYSAPFFLTGLSDGEYSIDYYSTDNIGNTEPIDTATVILDNTSPTTTLTIGEPKYISGTTYVTPDTPFTTEATDAASGAFSIAYRIYNAAYDSGWQTYTTPFKLTSLADGTYTIEYNSTDNVKNVETSHTATFTLFHWNYIYQDTYGRGTTLKINLCYKFFQFIRPDKAYSIRKATCMKQCGRAIIISHCDKQLRLITVSVDTKIDFCYAIAWDLQTRKCYTLIDKAGIE